MSQQVDLPHASRVCRAAGRYGFGIGILMGAASVGVGLPPLVGAAIGAAILTWAAVVFTWQESHSKQPEEGAR